MKSCFKNCLITFSGFTVESFRFLFICHYLGPPEKTGVTIPTLSTSTASTLTFTTSTLASTTSIAPSRSPVRSTQPTQPARPSGLPLWTWWSPGSGTVRPEEDRREGEAAGLSDVTERVISSQETDTLSQGDYTEHTSNRDTREEQTGGNHLNNLHSGSESKTEDDDHKTIEEKYQALVAHNTRLIDILRTTLEMQADLFRRMIRYLFP